MCVCVCVCGCVWVCVCISVYAYLNATCFRGDHQNGFMVTGELGHTFFYIPHPTLLR